MHSLLHVLTLVSVHAARHKPVIQKFDLKTVNRVAWSEQVMARRLLKDYDPAVRPPGRWNATSPVLVHTSLFLRAIEKVSDELMQLQVEFRFQQEWVDPRLEFGGRLHRTVSVLHMARDQALWRPDTFFQNEKRGHYHHLDQPNFSIKVLPDGKVIYNRRLSLTLGCDLNLVRYPMDVQTCNIDFASYAYTTKDIVYVWEPQPLQVHPAASDILPNFFVRSYANRSCTSKTATGEYSCLRVAVGLERVFSFFVLQLYVPSTMLVIVSWISYWIDWRSTAARVPLAIVTLLTMINQANTVNSTLPPVSYTKAIDVWIGGCILFIFSSLLEYAVVNWTGTVSERERSERSDKRRARRSWDLEKEKALSAGRARPSLPLSLGSSAIPTLVRRRTSGARKGSAAAGLRPSRQALEMRELNEALLGADDPRSPTGPQSTSRVALKDDDWTLQVR